MFAAGIRCANIFAEPVIVHLVDAVNQDESRLGIVVGRCHDEIPQPTGRNRSVRFAGNLTGLVGAIAFGYRPVTPDDTDIVFGEFRLVGRKYQFPLVVVLDGLHETIGDEAGEVELAEPAVFALGANKVSNIRVGDVKSAHLGPPAPPGRRDRKAHGIVDIHERKRSGGIGASAADESPLGSQGRELITDSAARFQSEPGLVGAPENAVH